MSEEQEKLLDALWTIKEECKKHRKCKECPFGDGGTCLVLDTSPQDWFLKSFDGTEKHWSPFKEVNDEL